jgi:hypothetical protein
MTGIESLAKFVEHVTGGLGGEGGEVTTQQAIYFMTERY